MNGLKSQIHNSRSDRLGNSVKEVPYNVAQRDKRDEKYKRAGKKHEWMNLSDPVFV